MVHEPPGFRRFVEARYSSLVRFGVVLCGDLGRGEDLTQAALVKTLHAWNRQGVGLGDPEGHTRAVMAQQAWRTAHRRRGGAARAAAGGPAVLDGFVPADTDEVPEVPAPVDAGEADARARSQHCPHSSGWCWCCATWCISATPRSPRSCAARPAPSATASAGPSPACAAAGLLDETVGGEPR